jgi:VWFA-related protein
MKGDGHVTCWHWPVQCIFRHRPLTRRTTVIQHGATSAVMNCHTLTTTIVNTRCRFVSVTAKMKRETACIPPDVCEAAGLMKYVGLLLPLLLSLSFIAVAQDDKSLLTGRNPDKEDVLRIRTSLIQAGVFVTDKKGNFVGDLNPEDFEITVDGQPVPIVFFERNVTDRSSSRSARNSRRDRDSVDATKDVVAPLGRNIIFVVDDPHLSFSSHYRVKKVIANFVDREMQPNDRIAIVSPTGQLGFLQQFIEEKWVLKKALNRLVSKRDSSVNDGQSPPMSEYEALVISRYDLGVTDIFAAREAGIDLESRRESVRSRARRILAQAAMINRGTYSALEQVLRNSARIPGRKTAIFFSDGFLLDPSGSDSSYRLNRIIDAAARTNSVIYTVDARGLEASLPEGTTATSNEAFRLLSGSRFETQDGLAMLANKTGGQFVRNRNDIQSALSELLAEAAQHYLLAWEPLSETGRAEKLRKIAVVIKGRPELTVRFHSGYLDVASPVNNTKSAGKTGRIDVRSTSTENDELEDAALSGHSVRSLPMALAANYADVQGEGMVLSTSLQIRGDDVNFTKATDQLIAKIEVLGIIFDSNGKQESSFRRLLTVDGSTVRPEDLGQNDIFHDHQIKVKPGLYQIRIAARDIASGNVGNATRWVEVPNLQSRELSASSILLSESKPSSELDRDNNVPEAAFRLSVDGRFAKESRLRYRLDIYNAFTQETGKDRPRLVVDTKILQSDSVVMRSELPLQTDGQDPARVGFAAEIPLSSLKPGCYHLQAVIRDQVSGASVERSVAFWIE